MNILTGMLIGIEKLTNINSKIWIDAQNKDVITFSIATSKLANVKMGDHLVVYKDKSNDELNVKLLNELV